jgi:8-oxo-dGTP pyrophosphatase MutT (NUDIX family)
VGIPVIMDGDEDRETMYRPMIDPLLPDAGIEARWRDLLQAAADDEVRDDLFPPGTALQPAAVLLPLIRRGHGYDLLFTKRAANLQVHAGQISFPGGRQDPDDADLWATAVRETHEEIGVPPELVEPLCPLEPIVSITRFHVTPFAGFVPADFPYRINTDEVDTLLEVPLHHLLDPATHQVEMRQVPDGRTYQIHHYRYGDHDIWGMTGHIVHRFLQAISQ